MRWNASDERRTSGTPLGCFVIFLIVQTKMRDATVHYRYGSNQCTGQNLVDLNDSRSVIDFVTAGLANRKQEVTTALGTNNNPFQRLAEELVALPLHGPKFDISNPPELAVQCSSESESTSPETRKQGIILVAPPASGKTDFEDSYLKTSCKLRGGKVFTVDQDRILGTDMTNDGTTQPGRTLLYRMAICFPPEEAHTLVVHCAATNSTFFEKIVSIMEQQKRCVNVYVLHRCEEERRRTLLQREGRPPTEEYLEKSNTEFQKILSGLKDRQGVQHFCKNKANEWVSTEQSRTGSTCESVSEPSRETDVK